MYYNTTKDYIIKAKKNLNIKITSKGNKIKFYDLKMLIVFIVIFLITLIWDLIFGEIMASTVLFGFMIVGDILVILYCQKKNKWNLEINNNIVHLKNLFRNYNIPYCNLVNMFTDIQYDSTSIRRNVTNLHIRIEYIENNKVRYIEIPYADATGKEYDQFVDDSKLKEIDTAFLTKNQDLEKINNTEYQEIREPSLNNQIENIIENDTKETKEMFSGKSMAKQALGILIIAIIIVIVSLWLGLQH